MLGLLVACGQSPQNSNATPKKATQAQEASAPKINQEIKTVLKELLPQCEKVEYVFYKKGMSFSTETAGANSVLPFYNFISDTEVTPHQCKFDGGAVFRSPDGDIVMTGDFVLNDQNCRSFKVTAKGKTYYQAMDETGFQYLMRFYNIDMGKGQG